MRFKDRIKGAYFFLEDKWYSALDKINTKIPVYKVIDPIDRVVPSFILFLLLILFLLILIGHFIQFATPYDVTIITSSSTTKVFLSGVNVGGELNGTDFSGKTDSDGEFFFIVEGTSRNFFGIIWSLIIPSEINFSGYVNASKEGYIKIKKEPVDLTSTKYTIRLEPLPENPEYPSSAVVELQDSVSKGTIVDSTGSAYIKFRCENKSITEKTVRDEADGSLDGEFELVEENCQFLVTKAYSPDYKVKSVSQTLPTDKSKHIIFLTKDTAKTTGNAKVFVYDSNTNPKEYIDGIKVVFNGSNENGYNWTNDGVAEKELKAGEYVITITDKNYYEITAKDDINITIEPNKLSQIEIGLQKINPVDRRKVYFKVIDSADGNVIKNVRVDLLWLYTDSNGNQFGTNGDKPLSYYSGDSHTGSNGLFFTSDLTIKSEGQIVAILKKDGYVYKVFKPQFFKLTEGPEIIQLKKSSVLNSGFAQITVTAGDSNRPLIGAQAYLYINQVIGSKLVTGIALEKNGKPTNSSGVARYSDLAIGSSQLYFAQAKFLEIKSEITPTKQVDTNQTMLFNIHMNLEASYLEIELIDYTTKNVILNSNQAIIEIYTADPEFSNIVFSEKVEYNFGFTSVGYLSTQKLLIRTKLAGYINQTFTINQQLYNGSNKIRILMIPTTMATGDVNILFDKIYKDSDFMLDGNSSVEALLQGEEYVGRFFTVIGKELDYKKALSFSRVIGPTNITNIFATPTHLESQDAYTCNTSASDSNPTHNDNYYLPAFTACKIAGQKNQQAGFKWSDENLEPGVYTFSVTFSVDTNAKDDDLIQIHYRAKEKHNPETETPLMKLDFYVGQILANLGLTATINDVAIPFTENISPTVDVNPGETNKLKIKVFNTTNENVTTGSLNIYSYQGSTTEFNESSLGSSKISFSPTTPLNKLTLSSNLTLVPFSNKEYDANFYLEDVGNSSWIVVVMKANDKTITKFIDVKSRSGELVLDAEFLAMTNNQEFNGFVNPKLSGEDITIQDMTIAVRKNCGDLPNEELVHYYSGNSILKEENYFKIKIPGVYNNGVDCVDVEVSSVSGPNGKYDPLQKRLYAGTANAQDLSLACIDVQTADGDPDNLYLDWEEDGQIKVINTCNSGAEIQIETGIECDECWDVDGDTINYILASNASQTFNLTGKNITYSTSEKFSDILGYFPFVVKAKLVSGGPSRKRFAVADEIGIHIRNESECFAISKDVFDFLNEGDKIDFKIDTSCQYTELGDYFVPRKQIRSLNINLNSDKPEYSYIDFNWELNANGGTYSVTYTTEEKKYFGGKTAIDIGSLNKTPINSNSAKYLQASVDFSELDGNIDELVFKWQDVDNGEYFGAAISGNITVTYKNGSSIEIEPNAIMFPGDKSICVCDNTNYNGFCNSATNSTQNYCLFGVETLEGLTHLTYGITHNAITKGEISTIDFDIVGNANLDYLKFEVIPHIIVNTQKPIIEAMPGSEIEKFKEGSFRIYPIEGATSILSNIAYNDFFGGIQVSIINPNVSFEITKVSTNIPDTNLSNSAVILWIEGKYLKARFLGDAYAPHADGSIELELENNSSSNIQYSIINIEDYVNAGGFKNPES